MAVEFSNVDNTADADDINCGSGASLDNVAIKSIAVWICADVIDANYRRICDKRGGTTGFLFAIQGTNTIAFVQDWSTTAGIWNAPNNSIATGAWYHVGVVYNRGGAAPGSDPVFYVGGALVATTETSTPAGTVSTDAGESLIIGSYGQAIDKYSYDGKMEDPRVFNRAMTAEEFALLASGYRGPLGGEICWLDLQLARGAWTGALTQGTHIFNDLSGNSNDGDPYGSPSLVASECPRMGVLV